MNNIKSKNFIKKILAMLLVIFILSGQTIALARSGGGRSSSSHSSSSYSGPFHNHTSRDINLTLKEKIIIIVLIFAVIILGSIAVRKVKLAIKKYKSISVIENLSKHDSNWNFSDIKKDIEEAFYMIQIAWRERNQDLAKKCMSDYLYEKHKLQTDAMKLMKEKNIIKKIVLLEATPIGLQDKEGTNKDYIWVHIKAKAKDYTIDEETNEVIQGNDSRTVHFEEYWKFIRAEKRWVLDDIRQIYEKTDLDFFSIEAPNKYY